MHPGVKRITLSLGIAAVLIMGSVGGALATVTFDPGTGTGYVPKTDVQAAFGWREGTFQANARKLGFEAATYTSWTWTCLIDGQSATLHADLEDSWLVAAEVVAAAGHRRSADGFDLVGLGAQLSSTADADPASCPEGDPSDIVTSTTNVLYAVLRGRSEAIWTD